MMMAFSGAAASAAQTRNFEAAVGAGQLSFPGGVAVDNTTGDLYVADAGSESLLRFDAAGGPADFSSNGTNAIHGIAFDGSANQVAVAPGGPSTGDFYVTNSFGGGIQAFAATGAPVPFTAVGSYITGNTLSGTPEGAYGEACGVAVDGSGTIYVGDFGGFVDIYAPSGEFLTKIATTSPCAVAVDSLGVVYAQEFNGAVSAFTPSAFPVTPATTYGSATTVDEQAGFGVAVDPADDQLYVNEGSRVAQFGSFSEGSRRILTFGSGQLGEESRGVAVDRSGGANQGDVYASKPGEVDRFGPLVTVPEVTTGSATDVEPGNATLRGTVDPDGVEITSCRFELGPEPTYGEVVPCAESPAGIGTGETAVPVHAELVGVPAGLYHYRLTVGSANGSVQGLDMSVSIPGTALGPPPAEGCPNAGIRALQSASQLPDCRAYELVSPADKNGTDVKNNDSVQAATSGDAAVFSSLGGFVDSPSATVLNYYRAERGTEGWTSNGISPPVVSQGKQILSTSMMGLSDDLSGMVMRAYPAPPTAPGGQPFAYDFYRREIPAGPFENLTPEVPSPVELIGNAFYAGANSSLSTIGIDSNQSLPPYSPVGANQHAYIWQDGQLHFVGILPDEEAATRSYVGGIFGLTVHNAISEDGSQVVVTAQTSSGAFGVFLREGLTRTVEASASQRVPPEATPRSATFEGASASGDKIFFTTEGQLLNSDSDTGNDLYVFEPGSGSLRRISVDTDPIDGEEANVVRVLGMSEDGDELYFAAQGMLVPGQPEAEGMNIYAWRDSGGPNGTLAYVTTLSSVDEADWAAEIAVRQRRVQVSPDGRYLLYTSATRLGSFDNAGHTELYRYDAETGKNQCVSCDPSGAAAVSDASMFGLQSPIVTGIDEAGFSPHNVLDDGRVFFETADPLVLGDSNGQEDVYVWEDGRPSLISSGQSSGESHFGDASASGDDVFFLTGERLVGADTDNNVDLYDARVDGGIAAQNTVAAAPCEGEGCRGAATATPAPPVVASSAVASAGNPRHHHHKKHRKHHKKHRKRKRHRKSKGKLHPKRMGSHHRHKGSRNA